MSNEGPLVGFIEIEDVFVLSDGKTILMPDFSTRDFDKFENCTLEAVVERPDGTSEGLEIVLEMTHFNIPTSSDTDRRWRIHARTKSLSKAGIPVSSIVKVDMNDLRKLGYNKLPHG